MTLDSIKCKICDSYNTYQIYEGLNIIRCSDCLNSFRINYPDKIIENYKMKIPMPNFFDNTLRNRHHYNFIRKNLELNNINKVLEIGSGSGSFIRFIKNKNKNMIITIIEPGSAFIPKLKKIKDVEIYNDFVENINLSDKFDLIILSHVLEHVKNPVNLINYLYNNLLKEGGYLYIDIPNADYELRNINAAKLAPLTHLFFFDGIGIKSILESIGFSTHNIISEKYKTLPSTFILSTEKLGSLSNKNELSRIYLKLKIKISLYFSSIYKSLFNIEPLTMDISQHDSNFNNIAIISKK